jgi:hypothetical protein
MPLNILDLDDIESHISSKLDRWLKEFTDNFLRPVVDAQISQQLQQAVATLDPEAARKIHKAMGGDDDADES